MTPARNSRNFFILDLVVVLMLFTITKPGAVSTPGQRLTRGKSKDLSLFALFFHLLHILIVRSTRQHCGEESLDQRLADTGERE